ncbi:MAG: endonuclease MutS2 [Anaerolineales bacterium]
MDEKTLKTLEFDKVLARLAEHTDFPVSREKSLALRPTADIVAAQYRQALTTEARLLLNTQDVSIGGARDVRQQVDRARHAVVLDPHELLDIKFTLIAARQLVRFFEKLGEQFPNLADLAAQIPLPEGLIDRISRSISERGDILDSASPTLSAVRRETKITHDRLMGRLQKMVSDSKYAPYLQESIVTQRDGRFVIPLRAEFKGRIKAIVHDQSSSGATLFVEPLGVVEMNNQHRELILQERDEERKILAELSQQAGAAAGEIEQAVDLVAELDVAFASAKYAFALRAAEPILIPFKRARQTNHPGSTIRLFDARHPLLDPETVVPIDVDLDAETYALVITGPNTGGKTVSLKTVGLLILMAQAGLHIPAQSGSEVTCFEQIFADIGDEQSIEQSLSTFSGHIKNIIGILNQADDHSLVILDELGAGTDPQEGAALARSLLTHLLQRQVTTLVTTHHPELKAFAHTTPGVVNASVEFNLETLEPTYRLVIGLPGRSNALAIARRLGLPEELVESARSELNPDDLQAESLLDEIHRQRDIAHAARTSAETNLQEAEQVREKLIQRLEDIEAERREVLEQARLEAQRQIDELQEEVREARKALARARQPLESLRLVAQKVDELEEQVDEPVERLEPVLSSELAHAGRPANAAPQERKPLRLGSRVYLRSLGTEGVVISLSEEEAEVQVGMMRVRARRSDLDTNLPETAVAAPAKSTSGRRKEPAAASEQKARPSDPLPVSPGVELDMRGQRVEEALDQLDRHLDAAFLANLPWVRVIHGKGTGRLRDAVRAHLEHHPQVKSIKPGQANEGGDGVTIVYLKL